MNKICQRARGLGSVVIVPALRTIARELLGEQRCLHIRIRARTYTPITARNLYPDAATTIFAQTGSINRPSASPQRGVAFRAVRVLRGGVVRGHGRLPAATQRHGAAAIGIGSG